METATVSLEQVEFLLLQNGSLLEQLSTQLAEHSELLLRIYICQLFAIGVFGAVGVLCLLYKFLKAFY